MKRCFLLQFIILLNAELFYVHGKLACGTESADCECGWNTVERNKNLANGKTAVPDNWSMLVSLRYDCQGVGNSFAHCCTGTILSKSYILTSAKCVHEIRTPSILSGTVSVLAGIHDRSGKGGISRKVDQIYVHPDWKITDQFTDNIAILHLSEPFDFTTNLSITPVCRPHVVNSNNNESFYLPNDTSLFIAGWNSTASLGSIRSEPLPHTTFHSVNRQHLLCANEAINAEKMFCTQFPEDKLVLDTMNDAGVAALRWMHDRWEQVGIISQNIEKSSRQIPNELKFTRITVYNTWIDSIIQSKQSISKRSMKKSMLPPSIARSYPIRYRCDPNTVSCGCGREQVVLSSKEMLSYEEAKPNSWPMIASLRLNGTNQHECSATIINDFFVLTAAHCVDKLSSSPNSLMLIGGIHDLFEGGVDIIEVDQIHLHPDWVVNSDDYQNDIAILRLSRSIEASTNTFVRRTCVPYTTQTFNLTQYPPSNSSLAIVGWQKRCKDNSNNCNLLQQVEVSAIDNDNPKCKLSLKDKDKQFCAEIHSDVQNSCSDDSGGAIFQWKGHFWEQVGITSMKKDCDKQSQTYVFTRLVYYFDWMERIINESLTTTTREPPVTSAVTTYRCDKTAICGCSYNDVALPSSRIVGGNIAIPNSWSMVVSLRRLPDNEHVCGGSILNDFFVLTAAHCVVGRPKEGRTNLSVAAGGNQQFGFYRTVNEVDQIHIHPEWVPGQLGNWNDIAIVRLSKSLNLSNNPYVKRTCLQRINSTTNMLRYPLNGTRLTVIGWGVLDDFFFSDTPDYLQQVEIFVIDKNDRTCDGSIKDKARQFCAGIPIEGGKDSCRGDSGGPILEWKGSRWEQVGIVSYGFSCGTPTKSSVYTQVANYIDWIEAVIDQSSTVASSSTTILITFRGIYWLVFPIFLLFGMIRFD